MKEDFPVATRAEYLGGDVTPKIRATLRRTRLDFGDVLIHMNDEAVIDDILDPAVPVWTGTIIASATNGAEILRSIDNGASFTQVAVATGNNSLYSIVLATNGDYIAGTGVAPAEIWRSQDDGLTWAYLATLGGGSTMTVQSLVRAVNGDLLAGTYLDGKIWRSQDMGVTWAEIGDLGDENNVHDLVVLDNGDILAGTSADAEIWRSQNNGETWTKIKTLTGELDIFSFVVAANGDIIAGTGTHSEFWRSQDDGDTWTEVDTAGMRYVVRMVRASNDDLVAAVQNYTGEFWRSQNNGETWAHVHTMPYGGGLEDMIVAQNGDIIACGRRRYGPGSFWRSQDNGATWAELSTVAGSVSIVSLGPTVS